MIKNVAKANGTPSISAVYAGKAGVSLINEIGVENIRVRTLNLTKHLVEKLYENNYFCLPITKKSPPSDPKAENNMPTCEKNLVTTLPAF